MEKKFVPLSNDVSPVSDPTKVKTWEAPMYKNEKNPEGIQLEFCCDRNRECEKPPKKENVEEDIYNTYKSVLSKDKKAKSAYKKSIKQKCKQKDKFKECVRMNRTPSQLKANAIIREKAIRIREKLNEVRHDAQDPEKYLVEGKSLMKFDSPTLGGGAKVKVKKASPSCSADPVFVPSRRILDLKRPRSSVFLNEKKLPDDISIPFETYNPRLLQPKADGKTPQRLIERNDKFYIRMSDESDHEEGEEEDEWTTKQRICTEPCCCLFFKKTFEDANEFEECLHNFPKIFQIPEDLNRWFNAKSLLGTTRCKREKEEVKKEEDRRRRKSLAALYTAFFQSLTMSVNDWEQETIDEVIANAEQLQEKSNEWYYQDKDGDFDIIPEDEEKQATLKLELLFKGALNCYDPNILKALSVFFKNGQVCIVQCNTLYLLIWRMCDVYCIFDPNARNDQCERDWFDGKASVMTTKPLEHVVHIILNLSDLQREDEYSLYEVRVINFGAILSPIETNAAARKKKLYVVVNKFYAVIPGTKGMDPPEDSEDFNPSLLVALIGLIYAQIDPARHWPRHVIDNVIKLGERYSNRYLKAKKLKNLNVKTLPPELYIGNFRADLEIQPFESSGHITECFNYRFSPLTSSIKQLFKSYRGGLIQIDTSVVAVWRDADFYYVFDPFQRGSAGQVIDTEEDSGNAILQMHIIMESLCRMLYKNALGMKSDGNFFIHPVVIKSITYVSRNQSLLEKGKDTLKIGFPIQCDIEMGIKEEISCTNIKAPPKPLPSNVVDECLSILSVSPCERTCSETEVYEQEKKEKGKLKREEKLKHADSLESLLDSEKISEVDSGDIALPVLEHIICLIMVELAARSKEPEKEAIKAKKVLLKTDRGYLESLKVRVKRRQDYDNIYAEFPTQPIDTDTMIPLKQELNLPSNFTPLPDGAALILGNSQSEFNEDENLLTGLLAAIAASVIARKYKVSTWSSDIIDYAMETGKTLQEAYKPPKDVYPLLIGKQIPKVQLGSKIFRVGIEKINSGVAADLSEILEKCFMQSKFLILLFNSFSCAVFRRYNFFYLFVGFPCDFMGFRSGISGTPCFLRSQDFTLLVNRIDFNRLVQSTDQGFIVLNVHVKDISPDAKHRFPLYSPSSEEIVYQKELAEKRKADKRISEKMAFLDDELMKEKERIRAFNEEKAARQRKGREPEKKPVRRTRRRMYIDEEGEEEFTDEDLLDEEEEGEEEEEEEEHVEKKHIPGRELDNIDPAYADKKGQEIELGYRLRETDGLFKIQGTTAMEGRAGGSTKVIRSCYFAGVYAVLFAILRPLSKWEFRRIDQVIENANELFQAISDKSTACDRKIDNLRAETFLFNLTVKVYDGIKVKGTDISNVIDKISKTKQYFLLQISNRTFAVYKDQYWHLFDPYKSLETLGEKKTEDKPVLPKGITKYPDRDAASWVLFPNKDTMLEYIAQRAQSPNWRIENKFHIVDIRSYKNVPKKTRLVHFLLADAGNEKDKIHEDINCLAEEVKWLEGEVAPWSRTSTKNVIGDERGIKLSLWKAFDIEIPKELFSLWGSLHPMASVFKKSRGKQYLATNVIACCMASLYRITEWNPKVLDTIVIHGDKYFNESTEGIRLTEYEFTLEDLNTEYTINHVHWDIHLESVLFGKLYNTSRGEFNLSSALSYFFSKHRLGVIQCLNRSLAFGRANKGYFLFDCESHGPPLFPKSQGAAYVLLCTTLKTLLYCMVMSLRIPYYNMEFVIHKVEASIDKAEKNDEEEEDEEEEEEEEEADEEEE